MVIEGLYELNSRPEKWLTFDQIYRLLSDNFGMSYQLVYRGLRRDLIFQRRKAEGVAFRRGARPYLYRLPHPQELKAEFAPEMQATPRDQLQRNDLGSLTAYRMGLHRELYIRKWIENDGKGFQMYRQLQAERLGVSVRTIRTYDKLLGHSNEANYKEQEITWANWNDLPRYKDRFAPDGKRLPSRKWLKTVDWTTGDTTNLPLVRYLAYKAMKEDLAVYEVERLANTYYPYQRPEKVDLADYDYDPVIPYFLEMEARNAAHLYQARDGSWYHQLE